MAKKPGRKKYIPSLGTEPLSPLRPTPPVKPPENTPFDFNYTDYVHTGECYVYVAACVIYGINPNYPGVIYVSSSDYRNVEFPEEIKELTRILCCEDYLGSNPWKPWWRWHNDIFYYINKALKIPKYHSMIINNAELMNAVRETYLLFLEDDQKKFSEDHPYIYREISTPVAGTSNENPINEQKTIDSSDLCLEKVETDQLLSETPINNKPVAINAASELGRKGAEKRHKDEKIVKEKVKKKFSEFPESMPLPEKIDQTIQWMSQEKMVNSMNKGKPFTKRTVRKWVDPLVPTDQKTRGRPKISFI